MGDWKWGILGTGNIANRMAEALQSVPEAQMVAVASRTQARADAFGEKWSIPRRYGSYGDLVEDKGVDVVYIASPHSEHAKDMILCLEAGKHVLCEKAFTLNAPQAAACISLAREKRLFLMEAMWMRFFPAMAQVRKWVETGLLGDVRLVQADFCFQMPYDPEHRLYNPLLGGGALLDLGIYPLSLATMVLGLPEEVSGTAHLSDTGVDELDTFTLTYDRGATAALSCSIRIYRPRIAYIVGTKGYAKIHEIFFRPERLTLALNDKEPETTAFPYKGNGFVHEVEEVHKCLDENRLESAIMPLDETLALMKLMDGLRAQWGVVYPGEMTDK
jgi:predicted dehydrogenase